jgi:hypothetical protein
MEGLTWCELASGAERHAEVWRVDSEEEGMGFGFASDGNYVRLLRFVGFRY